MSRHTAGSPESATKVGADPVRSRSACHSVPMVIIPIILLGRRTRILAREAQSRVADISAHAEESLNAIRTVQALLGHKDVKTTMIYCHLSGRGPCGVRSPLDRAGR